MLGSSHDLPAFVEILEEVGTWLFEREIPQWPPGSNREQIDRFRSLINEGELLLLRDGAAICGGCIVGRAPYEAWEGHPEPAVYLHKLAVSRAASGAGFGRQIVAFAEQWARGADRSLLRLDCWDGSDALRSFYRGLEFRELERAPEHGYWVRLFEKTLGEPARPGPER
jgi:GNAT superfamily N-acetyltransferase